MVSSSGSSGEEDGDANWRAAIESVAATTTYGGPSPTNGRNPKPLKHFQIKAQKLLDELIEQSIELVREPTQVPNTDNGSVRNEGGVRLFRKSAPGIVFDHIDELQGPTKRPKLVPGKEINEKSKKFKRQLQAIAVDGKDILASAQEACQKALAKQEAREAKAKIAAKREEERIAELKRIRGERWLPSIARDMQAKS